MNSLWRIILMTFLLLLFGIAVYAGDQPFCPKEYEGILKFPLVKETTCSNQKVKDTGAEEYPCELRISFNEKKNIVFLIVYSYDKSKVIWISAHSVIIEGGEILFDIDRQL